MCPMIVKSTSPCVVVSYLCPHLVGGLLFLEIGWAVPRSSRPPTIPTPRCYQSLADTACGAMRIGERRLSMAAMRRPALSYFALTFAISWGGMFLVIGGPGAIRGTE